MKEDILDIGRQVKKEMVKLDGLSPLEWELRALEAKINNEIKPIIAVMITISVTIFSIAPKDTDNLGWFLALVGYIALTVWVSKLIKKNIITMWCVERVSGQHKNCAYTRQEHEDEFRSLKLPMNFNNRRIRMVTFKDIMFVFFCMVFVFDICLYICDVSISQFLWSFFCAVIIFIHFLATSHFDNFIVLILSII
ncbi:MAG: hypothetical protein MR866_05925 [Selenomonadaceae bacterium]|nr:hypothetical protein [Selenomonadaceae bacterium]